MLFADVRLVAAAGATGKTTLMLLELAALAGGADMLHEREILRHGPVVYITGEDSREVLVARLRQVVTDNGMFGRIATILRNFFVADVSGTSFRLTAIKDDMVVASDEVDRLTHWLEAIKPIAIVIDPLASFSAGEGRLNDAEQGMIEAARRIRNALGCCVTLVHHVGKQNARDGAIDQYAFRGGSALADGARMVVILTKMDGIQWLKVTGSQMVDGEDGIRMTLAKNTYVRKQDDIILRRRGYLFQTIQPPAPVNNIEEIRESAILDLLRSEVAAGRFPTQNALTSMGRTPLLAGMSRATILKVLTNLTYRGLVERRPIPNKAGRGGARDYLHPVVALSTAPPSHQSDPAPASTPDFGAPDIGDPYRERDGSAAIAAAAPSGRGCADQQWRSYDATNHQSPVGGAE